MFFNDSSFIICFGDQQSGFERQKFYHINSAEELAVQDPLHKITASIKCNKLIALQQVHSNRGFIVDAQSRPYEIEGDFLITTTKNLALGISAADCLPIIFYEPTTPVIAIAHAGWQGSVKKIAQEVAQKLQADFKINLQNLKIFFGPSAKACCYQVGFEFQQNLRSFSFADSCLLQKNEKLFLDVPLFNKMQLQAFGIPASAFNFDYNLCTICNKSFCSYRRDGEKSLRQMTMVMLK